MRTVFPTAALLVLAPAVFADQISIPNTFSSGTTAVAAEVNANFSALVIESNAQDLRLVTLADNADLRGQQLDALADASDTQAQTIDAQAQIIDSQAQAIDNQAQAIDTQALTIDTLASDSAAQGMQLAALSSDVVDQNQRLEVLETANEEEEEFDHLVCNGGGSWATTPGSLALCTPRLDPDSRINTRFADVVRSGWVPTSVGDNIILFERKVEPTESRIVR